MRRPGSAELDLERWPGVDPSALSAEASRRYRARAEAIALYAKGTELRAIEKRTGLNRRILYRSLERALKPHPDGRVWGYRALIPAIRTKAFERTRAPDKRGLGLVGAFSQLLDQNPALERQVREFIRDRTVRLVQRGEKTVLVGLIRAHKRFVAACREQGLTARDYPLNSDAKAVGGLARTLRARMLQGFALAARAAGAGHVKPAAALAFAPSQAVTEPFQSVEFDAHKLDIRLKILDIDPYGEEHLLEIERVWLLVALDVATRAILGYSLCLKREYSRFDVIRTFERAIAPAAPPELTIAGLALPKTGGFVSQAFPETRFACWRQIRFDNARAHLASNSLDVACELLGCTVDVGPAYEPDDRPFIERFFGTVARQFSHRLPGSTGSGPADPMRVITKRRGDVQLLVSLDELQELLALWVWTYNGTPHGGLGGRTPLEAMHIGLRERGVLIRTVPEALRSNLFLMQTPHRAFVRGHIGRGEKPHISFYHVRYTSHSLAQAVDLIGRALRLYYDPDDIRVLHAYRSDGTELGPLTAGGLWSMTPHSLAMRIRFFRLKRQRLLRVGELEDPVEAYIAYRRRTARKSRQDASEIARIRAGINAKRTVVPAANVPDAHPDTDLPLAKGPVKSIRLRIKAGYAQ